MSLRSAATQCNDLRDSNQSKIDDLQKQIEALQSEANASNQKSLDLSNQADAAEAEIAKVVANATAAADFIKQELQVKKTTLATTLST
jgi:predicted  nucleic acid-binding Zn-ribbon protein